MSDIGVPEIEIVYYVPVERKIQTSPNKGEDIWPCN